MTSESTPGAAIDDEVRETLARGDINAATERVLRTYGPELIGWLIASMPGEADAQDAFASLSEELWRSLSRFSGRCSVRTWCYMLARQVASRIRTQPRRAREVLMSAVPSIAHAVTHVWNTSKAEAKQVQDVFAEIRKQLPEDDQTLLVLRVDRDLPWRDIALIMIGEDADDQALTRNAALLRKRFERVKDQLRALAAEKLPK